MLHATTACTFSTSQFFKSAPNLVCFAHFDFEICFAPQGVQFFISHLARWLLTRRFSEPTFRPSGATNQCFATLLPFRAPASSVFCLFLFSDLLSSSLLFSSLTLPTSSFSSVHIVESLISKLASVNIQGGQAYHIQPGPTKKGM